MVSQRKRVQAALGLHPELVPDRHSEVPLFEHLLPQAKYVGEIGLDGSPHLKGSFQLQETVLKRILKSCAAAGGRIMSLHSRRAATGVLDVLADEPKAGLPILHWFSGSARELERAISLGCWFSVGPIMLNSSKGRRMAELMPKERVLTETDAPFAQRAGEALKPWDVGIAYQQLADIWGTTYNEAVSQVMHNLRSLTSRPTY